MADVSLSSAVRDSLLSLQGTTDLINRTQGRLSSGLRVAGAADDPVAYFQSKSLNDRAADFVSKKEGIDQAVSTVSAALDGVTGVEAILAQMKGVAQSMKSATGTQFTDLVTQFNDLQAQIGYLTSDTTYQGINLINGTGVTLDVEFSKLTASVLNIVSVDLTAGSLGLNVDTVSNYTGAFAVSYAASATQGKHFGAVGTSGTAFAADTITLTWQGLSKTYTAGATAALTYGTASITITVGSTASALSNGDVITVTAITGTATSTLAYYVDVGSVGSAAVALEVNTLDASTIASSGTWSTTYVAEGETTAISAVITDIDAALDTTRSNATSLGTNVSLLQTRLNFTTNYVNTLEAGSGKLTLADINQEGANLLALQTRQQLGINSLAFAGQAEQSILSLFR